MHRKRPVDTDIHYHFKDSATGLFFSKLQRYTDTRPNEIVYHPKSLGKRFNKIVTAKTHLLYMINYFKPGKEFDRLHAARDKFPKGDPQREDLENQIRTYVIRNPKLFNVPYWLENTHSVIIPNTWQLIEVNRDNTQRIVDFDIQKFLRDELRNKALSEKFGQAGRKLYEKLEDAGKINEFSEFLIVSPKTREGKADISNIQQALKEIGASGKMSVMASERGETAIVFKDPSMMVHFRLAYKGNFNVRLFNFRDCVI